MGQVSLRLELSPDEQCVQTHVLKLRSQSSTQTSDKATDKREVNGTITVQYEWKPMALSGESPEGPAIDDQDAAWRIGKSVALRGWLKVTLVGADNLINLSYHKSGKVFSNPYAMVFLYPCSPSPGQILCPACWRSPSQPNTIHPRWGASQSWGFLWMHQEEEEEEATVTQDASASPVSLEQSAQGSPRLGGMAIHPEPCTSDSDASVTVIPDEDILKVLQRFGRDVSQLREEVQAVSSRIFQKISSEP
jgi:hypothetical protein